MKAIRQRYLIFTILCALVFIISLVIITSSYKYHFYIRHLHIIFMLSLAILMTFLTVGEYRKLVFAQLIVDNKIVVIQAVQAELKSWRRNNIVLSSDSIDIFISCFGILLGSRIIKFNTEGIYLKKIAIGKEFIEIYFGNKNRQQFIRLLNKITDENELTHIIEQFRRETGVIPKIVA